MAIKRQILAEGRGGIFVGVDYDDPTLIIAGVVVGKTTAPDGPTFTIRLTSNGQIIASGLIQTGEKSIQIFGQSMVTITERNTVVMPQFTVSLSIPYG